jgi:mono/diheme cytochrome c family protein
MPMRAARLTIPLLIALAGGAAAQDVDPEFAAGQQEYLAACAACHGENADGNGPIATMFNTPVPDLRKISARNDGVFPTTEIVKIVDGRTAVRAHGNPMPVFGNRYQQQLAGEIGNAAAQQVTRARVLELVYYLSSIQE